MQDAKHNEPSLLDRRRELRKNQTPQEEILWSEIRANRLGVKFKRQESVGGYIADFYCSKAKLIIELDGAVHDALEAKEYDVLRDDYFKVLNYKVLRFKNSEIENNLINILEIIRKNIL